MKNSFNQPLLFLLFLVFSNFSFSQLDSANVTLEFKPNTIIENGDTIVANYFEATVWVNDMDFFGEVVIDVFDTEYNYPVNKVKFTKQQLLDQSLISGLTFKVGVYNIEEGKQYKIVTHVRDYQGMNLPFIEKLQIAE